nr:calcitonin-1 [Urechis unicinctus]
MWGQLAGLVIAVVCLHGQVCSAAEKPNQQELKEALRIFESLGETRKGLNAVKRVVDDIDGDIAGRHELTDLSKKRRGLDILRRILSEMEADLILEQKRTCQFNLGGHCATESAASVADHWHYLNSAMSPGRKRRDTGLYRKLMTGKLFPQDH